MSGSGTPLKYDNFMSPYKGNTAFSLNPKLEEYKKKYFDHYAKDIMVSCVWNKRYDKYTFFFKVPSEENDKYPTALLYDVIIEFTPSKAMKNNSQNLAELDYYDIRVFSNSPGFVFTFDYIIYHKYGGFPSCVGNNLISKVAIQKAPVIRNTFEIMTVEKTTWVCFFHLVHNNYLTKEICKKIISTNNENYFIKSVSSQPLKLKEIKELHNIMREEKLKEKARNNGRYGKDYTKGGADENHGIFGTNFNMFGNKMKENLFKPVNKFQEIMGKRNDINRFKKSMHTSFKMK